MAMQSFRKSTQMIIRQCSSVPFRDKSFSKRLTEVAKKSPVSRTCLEKLYPVNKKLDQMSENVFCGHVLPMGIGENFLINGKPLLIPMVTEEPSVIAASSHGAKIIKKSDGFKATVDPPIILGQIQLLRANAKQSIHDLLDQLNSPELSNELKLYGYQQVLQLRRLKKRGGGFCKEPFKGRALGENSAVLEFPLLVQNAMGANLVNRAAEAFSPVIKEKTGWNPLLRILSNNASQRCAHISVRINSDHLTTPHWKGKDIAERIVNAFQFSLYDENRAVTNNKGVMNGVIAVAMATGQDTRALEAASHFHARHTGVNPQTKETQYGPLGTWAFEKGHLLGKMALPVPAGVVGRSTTFPAVEAALKILENPNSSDLGAYMACAGLASNLAALQALGTVGINKGHLKLHERGEATNTIS